MLVVELTTRGVSVRSGAHKMLKNVSSKGADSRRVSPKVSSVVKIHTKRGIDISLAHVNGVLTQAHEECGLVNDTGRPKTKSYSSSGNFSFF